MDIRVTTKKLRPAPVVWALSYCFLLLWTAPGALGQMTDVLTFHNDIERTGQALNEQVLTLNNVNTNHFGKLWTLPTDEKVLGEPLYVGGLTIPGRGEHNVVYVVTENDTVYAYDADSTNLFWKASMCAAGEEPYQTTFCSITPQIGITATPVIDRSQGSNGTIFVQAMSQTLSGSAVYQRLHALDLATGQDTVSPANITGTYPGNGDGSSGGYVIFDPIHYVDRAALLLLNGIIYVAWSAHCDQQPATCWVMSYDENTLAQTSVIDLSPNSMLGSIWNSGGGPSADSDGNVYVVQGDGGPGTSWYAGVDAAGFPVDGDYGCAMIKLSSANNALTVVDYFAMYNAIQEDYDDWDLGSGCAVVLPDMADSLGNARQLVVVAGKDQNVYLADRTNMGKYNPNNNCALYQELTNIFADANGDPPNANGQTGGIWSVPAYFNGTLYYGPVNGRISAFPLQNARLGSITSQSPTVYGYPGATPCISANGLSNGIVWTAEIVGSVTQIKGGPSVLHAYAATNLAYELYNSTLVSNDAIGLGQHFTPPMIASGRVYVGTLSNVTVFGLFDQSVMTPIQQWRNTNFGNPSNVGLGANSTCPAGDGVPNLVKYALGLNPFTPATPSQLASPGIVQEGYLTLNVNRAADPPDVTFVAQVSSNLLSWSSSSNSTTTLTNTATQLTLRDNTPVSSGTNNYMRLLFLPVSSP